jgi:hypothetical protein
MALAGVGAAGMNAGEIRGARFPRAYRRPVYLESAVLEVEREAVVSERLVENLGHGCQGGCGIWQSNIGAGRKP